MLGGHEQYRTSPTSQVQDSLIPSKVQLVEQFGPNLELASQRGVEVEPKNCQDEQGGQQWPQAARDDGENDLQSGHEGHESRRKGGVNSIRTTPSRGHALSHLDRLLVRVFHHNYEHTGSDATSKSRSIARQCEVRQ